MKASFNAATDGLAGIQQLAGDATLLYYTTDEAKGRPRRVQGEARARLHPVPQVPVGFEPAAPVAARPKANGGDSCANAVPTNDTRPGQARAAHDRRVREHGAATYHSARVCFTGCVDGRSGQARAYTSPRDAHADRVRRSPGRLRRQRRAARRQRGRWICRTAPPTCSYVLAAAYGGVHAWSRSSNRLTAAEKLGAPHGARATARRERGASR